MILPIEYKDRMKSVKDLHNLLYSKWINKDLEFENGFVVNIHQNHLSDSYFINTDFTLLREMDSQTRLFVFNVFDSSYKLEIDNENNTMSRIDSLQYRLTVNNLVLFDVTIEQIYQFIKSNCNDSEFASKLI